MITFYAPPSETCALLLPFLAFRYMCPVTSFSRIPIHVPCYFLFSHSDTCALLLPFLAFRYMCPVTSFSRILVHVRCDFLVSDSETKLYHRPYINYCTKAVPVKSFNVLGPTKYRELFYFNHSSTISAKVVSLLTTSPKIQEDSLISACCHGQETMLITTKRCQMPLTIMGRNSDTFAYIICLIHSSIMTLSL